MKGGAWREIDVTAEALRFANDSGFISLEECEQPLLAIDGMLKASDPEGEEPKKVGKKKSAKSLDPMTLKKPTATQESPANQNPQGKDRPKKVRAKKRKPSAEDCTKAEQLAPHQGNGAAADATGLEQGSKAAKPGSKKKKQRTVKQEGASVESDIAGDVEGIVDPSDDNAPINGPANDENDDGELRIVGTTIKLTDAGSGAQEQTKKKQKKQKKQTGDRDVDKEARSAQQSGQLAGKEAAPASAATVSSSLRFGDVVSLNASQPSANQVDSE
eukprot:6187961-Pleurochrysis_carterae.AAC.1